jgi:hypothetical protein
VGGSVAALIAGVVLAGAYDPEIDRSVAPGAGLAIGAGVQRLQDEFGLALTVVSPRFLEQRLAVVLTGGIGWYPDLRALPMTAEEQDFGAWSMYGHVRLALEASTTIAFAASRLYATLGPSVLLLSKQLSTDRVAIGGYGAIGVEIFAGDEHRAYPFSLYAEIGGVAHAAAADVENRLGQPMETDTTVDRLIGTGLALAGGVRIYLWR